jgi:hypothetical protein
MGDPERPLVVVDTPGHDSESFVLEDDEVVSAAIQVERQAEELVDALRKLDHVHAILVLHNDVYSNRLNPITYELLVKVDEIFGAVDGHSVWQNIIVAYSKCDSDAKGWRDSLKTKKLAMQAALCSRFERCRTTVPVMCVSGLSLGGPVDAAWLRNPAMRRLSPSGLSITRGYPSTALVRAGQGLKKKPRMRVGPRAALRQRQRSLRAGSVVARGTMLYRQRCR